MPWRSWWCAARLQPVRPLQLDKFLLDLLKFVLQLLDLLVLWSLGSLGSFDHRLQIGRLGYHGSGAKHEPHCKCGPCKTEPLNV